VCMIAPVIMGVAEQILTQHGLLAVRVMSPCHILCSIVLPLLLRGIPCLMGFGLFCDSCMVVLKSCSVLSCTDASTKLLSFVSDDVWGRL
jgi:hypothetical protein